MLWNALLALSVSIELVSLSVRVKSVKLAQRLSLTHSLTDRQTSGPIDRTPGTPGSDKKSGFGSDPSPRMGKIPT